VIFETFGRKLGGQLFQSTSHTCPATERSAVPLQSPSVGSGREDPHRAKLDDDRENTAAARLYPGSGFQTIKENEDGEILARLSLHVGDPMLSVQIRNSISPTSAQMSCHILSRPSEGRLFCSNRSLSCILKLAGDRPSSSNEQGIRCWRRLSWHLARSQA